MALQTVQGGRPLDIPTADENADAVDARLTAFRHGQAAIEEARERERARAFKWMRLPALLTGTAANSAIALTIGNGFNVGPDQGYAWSLRRVFVSGLTAGATPDVVNLQLHSGRQLWQLTGAAPCASWGKLALVLQPGDRLELASVGTFASTSVVTVTGELLEVPAEMLWKLI